MIVGEKTIGGKHGGWQRALGALKAWLVANGSRWFNGYRSDAGSNRSKQAICSSRSKRSPLRSVPVVNTKTRSKV